MAEQKDIPLLRFHEFNGDWEKKKIKELAEIKYGKDQKQIVCEDGKYPIMGTGGEIGRTNVFLYDKPSVMIGRKGTIDKPRYMDTPFWTVDTLFYTEVFEDIDPKWLYYKFETINWYLYNEASGVPSLSSSTIYSIPITTPILPEQQKIASFFTAIDQKISQLKRKKTLLEQYKKGVMQKIFSQEIRFKDVDGQDFPKWEKKKLGDIFAEINESVGDRDVPPYSITAGVGFMSQKEKFGRDISGQQNHKYTVVDQEQFSYNKGNSKTYHYGCIYINDIGRQIAVPNVFISFKLIDNNMSARFFFRLFESHYLDKELRKIISSSARMDGLLNVNKNGFFKLKIPCPTTVEQHKLGDFFYVIDDKINHTQTQIEKAEVWKNGLMQQMFV